MKQLTCEMCGGTDLVKDGGVFICQTCGCKYSVEEAKKMMVEGTVDVKGTVKIDRSAEQQQMIDNYLSMCKNAHEALDTATVVEYSDKILEIEPNNYHAWYYRALSCGWNSSLNDMKTSQVVTAAKRALDLAPEDEKYEMALNIYLQAKSQINSHMSRAKSLPGLLAGATIYAQKVQQIQKVMLAWVQIVTQIPYLPKAVMEAEIAECERLDAKDSKVIEIHSAWSVFKIERFSDTMKKALSDKIKRWDDEQAARREKYWSEHSEKKSELEQRKANAEKLIEELNTEMEQIPEAMQKKKLDDNISALFDQMGSLGLFKGKEKKALQAQIDDIKKTLAPIKKTLTEKKSAIQAKINEQAAIIAEVDAEFAKDR